MQKIGEVAGVEVLVTDKGNIMLAASCNIVEMDFCQMSRLQSLIFSAIVLAFEQERERKLEEARKDGATT